MNGKYFQMNRFQKPVSFGTGLHPSQWFQNLAGPKGRVLESPQINELALSAGPDSSGGRRNVQ
jgi:hypothetical protein